MEANKRFFFFSIISLILINSLIASADIIGDWRTFKYDTLLDANTETATARFDTATDLLKEFTLGNSNYSPRVITVYGANISGDTGIQTYLIMPGSDNILYIYDGRSNFQYINATTGKEFTGEIAVNDFYSGDGVLDIMLLEKNGALDESNFTWLTFDGSSITSKYTAGFGNSSTGINCIQSQSDAYYDCIFITYENSNHSVIFKVKMDASPEIESLNYTHDTYVTLNGAESTIIPAIRDIDSDNHNEAIFLSEADYALSAPPNSRDDLISVDIDSMTVETSFGGGDGIVNNVNSNIISGTPMIINVHGSDDGLYEIALINSDGETALYSSTGTLLWTSPATACNNGKYHSFSKTDADSDRRADIAHLCQVTAGNGDYYIYMLKGTTGAILETIDFYTSAADRCLDAPNNIGGQLAIADLDASQSYITETGFVTPCGINIIDYSGDYKNMVFNQSGYYNIDPIIADANGDSYYEIIYSKAGNTSIYWSSIINSPPVLLTYNYPPSPVCADTDYIFTADILDANLDGVMLGIDCLINNDISWGSLITDDSLITTASAICNWNNSYIGQTINSRLYIADEAHPYVTTNYKDIEQAYLILGNDSSYCYQPGTLLSNGTTSSGLAGDATEQTFDSILDVLGLGSAVGKAFLVIIIMIASIVALASFGGVPSIAFVIVIIAEFGIFAYLNWLPRWLLILQMLVASAFIVWLFMNATKDGGK